jgi:hypothetical protein
VTTYLFQELFLLNDIGDCLWTDTSILVDVFESVEHVRALVFDYLHLLDVNFWHGCVTVQIRTHLANGTFPDDSVEIKVIQADLAFKVYWF